MRVKASPCQTLLLCYPCPTSKGRSKRAHGLTHWCCRSSTTLSKQTRTAWRSIFKMGRSLILPFPTAAAVKIFELSHVPSSLQSSRLKPGVFFPFATFPGRLELLSLRLSPWDLSTMVIHGAGVTRRRFTAHCCCPRDLHRASVQVYPFQGRNPLQWLHRN